MFVPSDVFSRTKLLTGNEHGHGEFALEGPADTGGQGGQVDNFDC
jgi:hypothetical protein